MTTATGPKSESRTATIAVVLRVPTLAVTVVVPTAMAVTVPSFLPTVATDGLADDHSKSALVARPFASVACAARLLSSPTMRLRPAGEMVTLVGGPGMMGSVSPPQASSVIAEMTARRPL
jgi:hypothetical protein